MTARLNDKNVMRTLQTAVAEMSDVPNTPVALRVGPGLRKALDDCGEPLLIQVRDAARWYEVLGRGTLLEIPRTLYDAVRAWRDRAASVYDLVPEHLRPGLKAHCFYGQPTGHFLTAVLEDRLGEAVARGDDEALAALRPIVMVLVNKMPSNSHGSPDRVRAWIASGGWCGQHGMDSVPPEWDLDW